MVPNWFTYYQHKKPQGANNLNSYNICKYVEPDEEKKNKIYKENLKTKKLIIVATLIFMLQL